jgi:hypothetical protein
MIGALFVILVLVAAISWVVAILAAVQITALAPAGQRFGTWIDLGAWRFAKIRTLAGAAVDPHIKRYVQAFLAFFAVVIAAAVISIIATMPAQNGTPEAKAATRVLLPLNNSSSLES